jgi:hypothetical protein
MKRLFCLIVAALVLGAAACNQAATLTASFGYDYTQDPACATGITVRCIDHFEVYSKDGTGARIGVVTIPNPTPAIGTVTVSQAFQTTNYGSYPFFAIAVAKDSNGARVESGEGMTQAPVTVKPGSVQTFKVQ